MLAVNSGIRIVYNPDSALAGSGGVVANTKSPVNSTTPNSQQASTATQAPLPVFQNFINTSGNRALESQLIEAWHASQGIQSRAIASCQFMNVSKESYPLPWLIREIGVQNWVDHNEKNPGTLNGVEYSKEDLGNGKTRIILKGPWTVDRQDSFVGLDGKKSITRKSAGGNAIGLKQAALRLIRDFGVTRFTVEGGSPAKGSWNVEYSIVKGEEVNHALKQANSTQEIQEDWLVGSIQNLAESRNHCSYIIETDKPEIVDSFDKIFEYGVCDKNPYLDPRHSYHQTQIKLGESSAKFLWLDSSTPDLNPLGRLFVNGQVMGAFNNNDHKPSEWNGTRGVSIVLDNIEYKMSIDRPDINFIELPRLLTPFIKEMSTESLIQEIKSTQKTWEEKEIIRSYEKRADLTVIESMLSELRSRTHKQPQDEKYYAKESFAENFGEKIIARDRTTSDEQITRLRAEGYIIAPSEFSGIGAATSSSKLNSVELSLNETPVLTKTKSYDAQSVNFEHFKEIKSINEFFTLMNNLPGASIQRIGETNSFKITLPAKSIDEGDLFDTQIASSKLLYKIRGLIFMGLKNNLIDNAVVAQGKNLATHAKQYVNSEEQLIAKCKEFSSNEAFITIKLSNRSLSELTQLSPSKPNNLAITIQSPKPEDAPSQGNSGIVSIGTKETLSIIPVVHDLTQTISTPPSEIIARSPSFTPTQLKVLAKVEQQAPAIAAALRALDQVIPKANEVEVKPNPIIQKYLQLRASPKLYGTDAQRELYYLSTGTLTDVIAGMNQAKINVVADDGSKRPNGAYVATMTQAALSALSNRLKVLEPTLDINFQILTEPSNEMLRQLELLRDYVEIATNHKIPNDLFLFTGENRKGINISKKAIGLNLELFLGKEVNFHEALETFVHEVAHNWSMKHDLPFIAAQGSLHANIERSLAQIANKAKQGVRLDAKEQFLIEAESVWNAYKTSQLEA